MNILLTGSSGFIGKNFYQHYKDKYNIITIDKLDNQDLLTCDLPNADLVIHLAGLSGVRQSLNNPLEYWKQNVIVSQRLFDYYKDTRIMYASSSTAYEPWRNPYAFSKYAVENIAPSYTLGMRFTTTYGPYAREQMLIPKLIKNDINWINTNHKRDFIHVDDLIRGIELLIDKNEYGVIDIGTGKSHKITDIANYFAIDYESKIGAEHERLDNKANVDILKSYGWKPENDLYKYIEDNRRMN